LKFLAETAYALLHDAFLNAYLASQLTPEPIFAMMNIKQVEYVAPLGVDGRRRIRRERIEGEVVQFVVQYEIFAKGQWHPVVRYDTSHGFAHMDLMHADGRKEKTDLLLTDLNLCLTFAENDLRANWGDYRRRFLKEMEK
jgi:hypothetical protein